MANPKDIDKILDLPLCDPILERCLPSGIMVRDELCCHQTPGQSLRLITAILLLIPYQEYGSLLGAVSGMRDLKTCVKRHLLKLFCYVLFL